jgi:hypothetical protein
MEPMLSIMTDQTDLFDRAAECERMMNLASDPDEKEILKQCRDMWIALANDSPAKPVIASLNLPAARL